MTMPDSHVGVAFNRDQTRSVFTRRDPTGNIITAAMVDALRAALEAVSQNPHLKLITIEGSGVDFSFGARCLAPKSAAAIRHAAAAAWHGLLLGVRETLPALESLYLNDLMNTSDAVEGITAFLEKRPPRWSDR